MDITQTKKLSLAALLLRVPGETFWSRCVDLWCV